MSFYKRYELARLIQEGEAKTFNAVEIATRRPVLLHMLAPSAALSAAAVRDIVARAEHHPGVIEVGEFAGSYYIAVEPSDSFQSFRQWADSLGSAPATAPPKPTADPPPPAPPPRKTEIRKLNVKPSPPPEPSRGEFTEIFGVPKAKIAGHAEPGEFTKLFYGSGPGKSTAGKPDVLPELPGDATGSGGEFTQFFGGVPAEGAERAADEFKPVFDAPLSEPEDAPPVAAPSPVQQWPSTPERDDHTGEYTKFFGNSLPSEPVDIQAEQARQAGFVEPKEKPFQQATDFTRVFGPDANSKKTPPPPPVPMYPANSDGSSVSMIFGPVTPPTGVPRPVPQVEADDYAKVTGTRENPWQTAGFGDQQMAPPKKRTGLIIVLVVVGVILIALLIWAIVARSGK
jgi:hypothetical protein